ncbi:MAG: MATE family efflux transporter [Clostridia bacterium]|nr:MATE family efflux transporter [Clostridia bacterium]
MGLLTQPKGVRFSNKYLIMFFLPIFFEQLMLAGLGFADTWMVSSKLGTTALAGVALVNRIDNFAKQFFLALAQGGSVVLAQYIGAKDEKDARGAMKTNIQIVVGIGILFMLFMVFGKTLCINLFFGKAEKEVIEVSLKYLSVTAMSYPFVALYYTGSSLLRVMGKTKITFVSSACMMGINLAFKYLFIFRIGMNVEGAALSTLIAMALVGFALLIMLKSKKNPVSLEHMIKPEFDLKMSLRVLKISVPNGIEQGMFQLGALILAGLVSGLGEDAINADQVARNISPVIHGISAGFNALIMTVAGQFMGAGDINEAVRYKKHIIKMNHLFVLLSAIIFVPLFKPLISFFKVAPSSEAWALQILLLYTVFSIFFYPESFATASALRGTGDTRFVMIAAAGSMFAFRVGLAYILVNAFDLGVLSIWIAMVSDWVVRTVIFELRFRHGKWKNNHVI